MPQSVTKKSLEMVASIILCLPMWRIKLFISGGDPMAYWEWSECHQESGPQRSWHPGHISLEMVASIILCLPLWRIKLIYFWWGSYGILGMIRVSSRKWSPKKLTSRSHIPACIVLIGFWCTSENMWWHSVKKLCWYILSIQAFRVHKVVEFLIFHI